MVWTTDSVSKKTHRSSVYPEEEISVLSPDIGIHLLDCTVHGAQDYSRKCHISPSNPTLNPCDKKLLRLKLFRPRRGLANSFEGAFQNCGWFSVKLLASYFRLFQWRLNALYRLVPRAFTRLLRFLFWLWSLQIYDLCHRRRTYQGVLC
jgi:hypothetical protein